MLVYVSMRPRNNTYVILVSISRQQCALYLSSSQCPGDGFVCRLWKILSVDMISSSVQSSSSSGSNTRPPKMCQREAFGAGLVSTFALF